jgi:cytoskeletal protein RodZ
MNAGIPDLRGWRKNKGITLESIASATKLSVRLLQAIETGDFSKLPGGVYNTNYIRQYARAIDFDETTLLAWYNEASRSGLKEAATKKRTILSWPLLQP